MMSSTTPRNPSSPEWFTSGLASRPVMAVFRGLSPEETVALAHVAWDIGITQVEVPIESPSSIPSLEATIAAARERTMRVGAGTIITPEQLHCAIKLGAAYAVSPGLDPALIALADRTGFPILPGVATASEVLRAQNMGFTWVKAFPASVLGAPWFTAMKGPFPTMNFVATGGINGHNAADFLATGAATVGVGSALSDAHQVRQLAAVLNRQGSTT